MKIIGFSKNGYIIDASKDEIANLMGYFSRYGVDHDPDKNIRMPLPGEDINVEGLYKKLRARELAEDNLYKIKTALEELRKAYGNVESIIEENNKGEDE
ncbi:MAG: hypothetical protein [Caudoviricetes sp.]|nr:MAG: hypothetical protein [Caudoviricetes sp.]